MVYFDSDLMIKRSVPLSDYLLPYVLTLATAIGNIANLKAAAERETDPVEKQRLLDSAAAEDLTLRSLKRSKTVYLPLVQQLVQAASFTFAGYKSHEDHLDAFAAVLPDYHIRVYTRIPPAKRYSLHWEANPRVEKKVHIGLFGGYFDLFKPTLNTIGKFVCPQCSETYRIKDRHGCQKQCSHCRRIACTGTSLTPNVKCGDCGYYFAIQECFDSHKLPSGNAPSVCSRFKYCYECKKGYRADWGNHECGKSKFCIDCGTWKKTADHSCSWEPPTEKDKQAALKKQESYRIVFYDFETVQLEDSEDVDSFGEHWVNYACYSLVCEACIDLPPNAVCDGCGPRKQGHFAFQNGDSQESVAERFVDYLFSQKNLNNAYVLAHNGANFDLHFMVGIFLRKQFRISVVKTGRKIMCLTAQFQKMRIVFKDSYLFMPISLSKLPSAFGFADQKKGTFPFLYNHPDHYHQVLGNLPPIEFYNPENMKEPAKTEFVSWYTANRNNGFDFNKEIHDYCVNDVAILHEGVCRYIKTCLELFIYNPIVHAVTFASYSFFIIKYRYMQRHQVGIIPEHGFTHNDLQSDVAIKYLKWIEHKNSIEIHHFLRGPEHVIEINGRKYRVDGFHAPTNTVYEVLGCFWHGCDLHTNHDEKHPRRQDITYGQIYNETVERFKLIREAGYSLVYAWEHEIRMELKSNKEMRKFFDSVFHKKRLVIRDGFFGGRTQNFVTKAVPDKSKGQKIEHLDVTSMYPSLLRKTPMPIGRPQVITSNILPITLPLPYQGYYLMDILPPRDLLIPVVPYRIPGKLVFPLCRSCALAQKNQRCTHEEPQERFLHVVIWQKELEKALEKGYTVLRTFEVWHWDRWGTDLFKPLMDAYIKIKTEASGPPQSGMTRDQLVAWANGFERAEGIRIDVDKVTKNPAMRYIAKLGMNSPWGKYGEKPVKGEVDFIPFDSFDFETHRSHDHAHETRTLITIFDHTMVTFSKRQEFALPIEGTSVVVAAATTATGRLILYEALEALQERALYCDTDSVIMISEPGKDNLDHLRGDLLGKWTSEIPENTEIVKFVSTGPKVYSYLIQDPTGRITPCLKARGIGQTCENEEKMTFDNLERLVDRLVINAPASLTVTERTMTKRLFKITSVKRQKKLRAVMNKGLFFPDFSTLPYGYVNPPPPKMPRV